VFRRGSRHEAPPEKSSPEVDQQPYWLAGVGAKPEQARSGAALLGVEQPQRRAEQQPSNGQVHHPPKHSPFRGVSTQEVVEALGWPFSPPELDWELVGIAFVQPAPTWAEPEPGLEVWLVEERSDGVVVEEQVDVVLVDEQGQESLDVVVLEEAPDEVVVDGQVDMAMLEESEEVASVEEVEPEPAPAPEPVMAGPQVSAHALELASAGKRKRRRFREQDQIMAAVRKLSWEGYCSLIADIFRREGYDVFVGEGADGDVIDMEVVRGPERMLVSVQLRGMNEIDAAPVTEMIQVAARNGADGAFVISDGSFGPDAWSYAGGQPVVLIDGAALLGLVLDFTLGIERQKRLSARLAKLLRGPESKGRQKAS
jgi:hypothetical protein